jgi:hypothetical protein
MSVKDFIVGQCCAPVCELCPIYLNNLVISNRPCETVRQRWVIIY